VAAVDAPTAAAVLDPNMTVTSQINSYDEDDDKENEMVIIMMNIFSSVTSTVGITVTRPSCVHRRGGRWQYRSRDEVLVSNRDVLETVRETERELDEKKNTPRRQRLQ